MERRFDAEGRLRIDWEYVKDGARGGGRATIDDVTVMSDGRRIDSADKLREIIAEFDYLVRSPAVEAAHAVDAER